MCSRPKAWCPERADQICISVDGMTFSSFKPMDGSGRRSGHASSSIWPTDLLKIGQIHVGHDGPGCRCRHKFSDSNA